MAAHHLLGKANDGNLVLLAGPDWPRILGLVEGSGLRYVKASGLAEVEEVAELKKEIADKNQTIVVIASMPEVEGRLDRSTFERNLINLAYAADRVIYAGHRAAILVWPEAKGTRRALKGGHLVVIHQSDTVAAGETVTGLTVDSL